jgi:PPOX class probable F420-dependent enzyme
VTIATLEKLPEWAMEMLARSRHGHLGLLDTGSHPRVLPVTYALYEDALYSAVDEKPKQVPPREIARVRFLRRRPQAALTVDRYDDDWRELAWVQVLGKIEILEVHGSLGAVQALEQKYPQYRGEPPPGPLLKLVPERALCWRADG